jgi:hypothetical protein
MLKRGEFECKNNELIEISTGRRVFLRGVNVPAKLKPFRHNLEPEDFERLRSCGFTVIRLVVVWEALEPEEGVYDQTYMQYILHTVRMCSKYGISVVIDPHQDCWSRFTGGDGAPAWTLERLGFRIENMYACAGAAEDMKGHPLLWSTNYQLYGSATMFTLFFGSERFASHVKGPNGESAQRWLQTHFIEAFAELAAVLRQEANVLGFGTMNEPSLGWIGCKDLRRVCTPYRFGYGLSPMQCIRMANGESAWGVVFYGYPFIPTAFRILNAEKKVLCRSAIWPNDINPSHFALNPNEDPEIAFLHPFWDAFGRKIRERGGDGLRIFTEPLPLQGLEYRAPHRRPKHEIRSPHFYDFVTIGLQRFISWLTIDFSTGWPVFFHGVARARHNTIAMLSGVAIGEVGMCWLGEGPTNAALDATFKALESNLTPAAFLWCYVPRHTMNDGWNGENFSIWSNGRLRLQSAVRPYAMRVAGQLSKMQWDGELFEVRFKDNGEWESVLFCPRMVRKIEVSDGYCVEQAGMVYYYHSSRGVEHTVCLWFHAL